MRNVLIIFSCFLLFMSCEQKESQGTIKLISAQEMQDALQLESVQLVDVRTVKEFESGHIKNARNIVYLSDDWESQISKLDKEEPVYVYCAKGGRSAKCSELLVEAGFKKVYDLEGGITQWKNQGLSVE